MPIRADQQGQLLAHNGTAFFRADGVAITTAAHAVTGGFTAVNANTAVSAASTFTGGSGSSAYTVGDVVANLKALGLLAP